jgi:hypothetical protein
VQQDAEVKCYGKYKFVNSGSNCDDTEKQQLLYLHFIGATYGKHISSMN